VKAPKVLITGFGPFPGVAWNPSGWLVQTLARTHERPLAAAVLPVSWTGAWAALAPLLDAACPRHVILFGVSRTARGFHLEQRAYNTRNGHPDADGTTPEEQWLLPAHAESLDATLPLAPIASAVAAAGIPVALSDDPERYLCNALLFRALHWAQDKPTRVGFVHIPHLAETGPLTLAQALTGARIIVEAATGAEGAVSATA